MTLDLLEKTNGDKAQLGIIIFLKQKLLCIVAMWIVYGQFEIYFTQA